MVDVSERGRSGAEFRRAIRYGIGLVGIALIITPKGNIALGSPHTLFAMLLSATIMATAIIALSLLVQARATRSMPTAILCAGFAYCCATMIPYVLLNGILFPGVGHAIGAGSEADQYLWFLWQAGLLVALLAFQRLRHLARNDFRTSAYGRFVIASLGIAYALLTPCAIWLRDLPPTFEAGHWTPVFTFFMAPLLMLLSAAAIVDTIRRRNRTSVLEAWIAMVGFGLIVEVYLTLITDDRFTLAWYASRFVVFVIMSTVLAVLLAQAARLYADLILRAEVLESEAHTDILTGLPNRRRFDEEFARAFGSAIRRSAPISIAIIDIDHFKDYNDAFGHQAGDETLRLIARAIAESVERSGDFAARYGGEEFVVILEDTTLAGAAGVAERIRTAVLDAGIHAPAGGLLSVSAGVAARLPGGSGEALLRQADEALYAAKHGGRNRVESWHAPQHPPLGSPYDDPFSG